MAVSSGSSTDSQLTSLVVATDLENAVFPSSTACSMAYCTSQGMEAPVEAHSTISPSSKCQ